MMNLKPLSPPFETKNYLKEKLKDIGGIPEQLKDLIWNQISCPTYNVDEIYNDYYQRALAGEITLKILRGHQKSVNECNSPYEVDTYKEISYVDEGITFEETVIFPGGTFNLFNSLLPMVEQFALFAALSNAYLENEDLDQSYAFAIRAAQVWGSINRFKHECLNSLAINREFTRPLLAEKELAAEETIAKKRKGGLTKGEIAAKYAKLYWAICVHDHKFKGYVEKYPTMGLKFSDELFNLIKRIKPTKELPKIPYTSRWFYDNVTSKFRPKDKNLTVEEKIQFSLKSVQNSLKKGN